MHVQYTFLYSENAIVGEFNIKLVTHFFFFQITIPVATNFRIHTHVRKIYSKSFEKAVLACGDKFEIWNMVSRYIWCLKLSRRHYSSETFNYENVKFSWVCICTNFMVVFKKYFDLLPIFIWRLLLTNTCCASLNYVKNLKILLDHVVTWPNETWLKNNRAIFWFFVRFFVVFRIYF